MLNRSRSVIPFLLFYVLVLSLFFIGRTAEAQEPPPLRQGAIVPRDGFTPDTIIPATAEELALAMGVPAGDLVSADLMGSDPAAVGISTSPLGAHFPTEGGEFAILSTGLAASAELPNNEPNLSAILGGIDNNAGQDLVRLHLELEVPKDINCASFDFAFYSEEFPEYVGTQFNDSFVAQLNNSMLTVQGPMVIAPGNFAFDTQGGVIEVNTVFGVAGDTGTTYDGATPQLRARTAVVPGTKIDIYISVTDLGDSIYDTAVFMDRFFWSRDPNCDAGADVDTDGDGLLDSWETNGLTVTVAGTDEFVDLPAMGADPNHKDVFIEIDWMETVGHSHRPNSTAIATIVTSFNNAPVNNPDGTTGIHLHVDYGPTAPLTWGTAATWGTLSDGEVLPHTNNIGTVVGTDYDWNGVDDLKAIYFSAARAAVFHYNPWVHDLAPAFGSTSGISRNPNGAAFGTGASDFIVSLGSWPGSTGTSNQQAGTFMHELGHNLGLRHGGPDHTNYKPNYLSVMTYAFQTRGLIINGVAGNFDYSRYNLPSLDENHLNETVGITPPATPILGTVYFCGSTQTVDNDARTVDWNCDGDTTDVDIARNINGDPAGLTLLATQNDWDNLVYTGGAISQPGATVELPMVTEATEITREEDKLIPSVYKLFLPMIRYQSP